MIVMPAIDLRDGACVQLVGGSYEQEVIRLADPLAVADRWRDAGFRHLHVVDLDAATRRAGNESPNADIIEELLRRGDSEVQVGGGVADERRVAELLAAGAARVVVGTRALEDPEWLAAAAAAWPRKLVVALDARERSVLVRGWTQPLGTGRGDIIAVLEDLTGLPLAAVLITAVHVEGQLLGPDFALLDDALAATPLPLIASGGITTMDHLRELEARGVYASVIGMALYTGALDASRAAEEFAA